MHPALGCVHPALGCVHPALGCVHPALGRVHPALGCVHISHSVHLSFKTKFKFILLFFSMYNTCNISRSVISRSVISRSVTLDVRSLVV